MSRSGNHAVINWILRQFACKFTFRNCVKRSWKRQHKLVKLLNDKNTLISFENHELPSIVAGIKECKKSFRFNFKTILLLRDPLNWLSSLIKFKKEEPNLEAEINVRLKRQKSYMREYLGITSFLPNKIVINYNKWVDDVEYRKQIFNGLMTWIPESRFSDESMQNVSSPGHSSFDQTKYDGQAQKMDVFNRYRYLSEVSDMVKLDEEVMELAVQIFKNCKPRIYNNLESLRSVTQSILD